MTDPTDRLEDAYGERVAVDGDYAVVDGPERPLLVARLADGIIPPAIERELAVLRSRIGEHEASFGAVLTPDVEYVFRPTDGDYETAIPGLPGVDGTVEAGARPFRSATELLFCFHRVYGSEPGGPATVDDRTERIVELVRALRDGPDEEPDPGVEHAVDGVFGAYDFSATADEVVAAFVRRLSEADAMQRYSTRDEIAAFLVDLAGVEPGDSVLDPAAGVGTVLREAADAGADARGIEVHAGIVEVARFFRDLVGAEATITAADFLATSDGEAAAHAEGADHVIVEPPSTREASADVGSLVTREGTHIEELIVRRAAESLDADATLTAFVPFGMLIRPDGSARSLRRYLRREFEIGALIEISNPAYYPYPGVRTAVIQLTPADDPGDYEVPVATLEAAPEADRFGTTGEAPLETLLDETLDAIRSGEAETLPVSAFGETLAPSDVLRRRDIQESLAARYDDLTELDEVADVVEGASIPWRALDDDGVPYLTLAAVTGHASDERAVADPDPAVVADETDLLVSVMGTIGEVYHPAGPVVPADDWAVLRFDSADAALVYGAFLRGDQQRDALTESSIVPYPRYTPRLPLRRLRRTAVPRFDPDELAGLANEIRALDDPTGASLEDVD